MNNGIHFRKMRESDKAEVLDMMKVFYASPAVLTTPSDRILEKDFDDCVGECPFVTGFVMEKDNQTAGYMMTAMCYATEYGGLCIWIEDLYIKPEFRHLGAGTMALEFIENEYEKHDTDRNLIKQQRAAADEYMHEHLAALHALEEFENHEC